MKKTVISGFTHEQFCDRLASALQSVDLPDGSQLAISEDGSIAHYNPLSGQVVVISDNA